MGWNTTVVIYNDALGTIREDPKFGERLADAIARLHNPRELKPIDFHARTPKGGSASAGVVIETHHADYTVLVKVGGNTGEVVEEP